MALTHDIRLALAERVQRRVEGRGIPRHVIDDAVSRVGEALEQFVAWVRDTRTARVDRGRVHRAIRTRPWLSRSCCFACGIGYCARHGRQYRLAAIPSRPFGSLPMLVLPPSASAARLSAAISFVPDPFPSTSSQ